MNKSILIICLLLLFISCGCSSTFLVSKDGYGYFLGSDSKAAYKMLCESGDLAMVLLETSLPQDIKDALLRYSCSQERSREKVKRVFAAISPEHKQELMNAFRKNGYEINYLHC
ncbi:MAG: hypothetical protein HZA17_11175 [Nitrospirae bacterium]|nr:hypothetical protein [Nitrospirota bacterium]